MSLPAGRLEGAGAKCVKAQPCGVYTIRKELSTRAARRRVSPCRATGRSGREVRQGSALRGVGHSPIPKEVL